MIKKVGVLGAGSMGGGIAHLAAARGFEVVLCDVEQRFVEGAVKRIAGFMDKSIQKQKMTVDEKETALKRITITTNMEDLSSVDLVIEAIFEDMDVKKKAFEKLDAICGPDTIFGSNTSSMSITTLASATKRPDKVVGLHFFNPPLIMRLVEVIRGYYTSDETVRLASEVSQGMGKTPVVVQKDTPGFIVNRIMMPQFLEAIRIVEEGIATPADIDTAVKLGLNYPMGPFELMDFTGVEISVHVADYLFNESKDMKWNPPQAIKAIVRAGRLGKKTGAGWYDYNK
ncbi:3-hydroxyacyl-CoA dehydrogenase family protein [Desulfosporosinus meridiei]|uniref:3-hydroxybutyryl-CoA dehydrogenase n=1 Tax=Desulfosporosinus meridiei (strain ATCC BAA-275 / DSM 13257 / KCTC 12902 / NCIMB 13706 / S10) TaxID=768704 RepID=J7IU45_DESMD|nr:3-hydroxyacyl-CoA dehydrogenase family protein [Desulfosporosinus meridiei]AFQ43689.1 3-hydroxyacyl-CoA dehydrogenase [Desulfosporosinus meridiei DSM 13257]